MSSSPASPLITDRSQLVAALSGGEKPRSAWRIGTEHEKFGFRRDDLSPPTYEGERGIGAILQGLTAFGWEPVKEKDTVIALVREGASVSLEPAGQLELSGAPLEDIHATAREIDTHLAEVAQVAGPLDIGFVGTGFQPLMSREQMPWMPKGRYRIMRRYMPLVGGLGLDMMTRTCTVQVNLDFSDEADMVRKFRVALALQPLATALFADSPFTEGAPNGFQSWRSHIWTDTDAGRTGMLDFVFEDGFGYERYVDYLLDVPMYFVYRDGNYIDVAGQSFRDFLDGKLPGLPGERPTIADWNDHMTTAFPEVRLKKYLEMRGADSGDVARLRALPAFWVGLLYDDLALAQAWELVRDFSMDERNALRDGVPREGLRLAFRGETVRELAGKVLAIARGGLQRRAVIDSDGNDESAYLDVLDAIVASGRTAADEKLARFHGQWNGSVRPLFEQYAF